MTFGEFASSVETGGALPSGRLPPSTAAEAKIPMPTLTSSVDKARPGRTRAPRNVLRNAFGPAKKRATAITTATPSTPTSTGAGGICSR